MLEAWNGRFGSWWALSYPESARSPVAAGRYGRRPRRGYDCADGCDRLLPAPGTLPHQHLSDGADAVTGNRSRLRRLAVMHRGGPSVRFKESRPGHRYSTTRTFPAHRSVLDDGFVSG